ncbi:glycogen/starch/alpha-glucan phosphorylase [Parachlamydia acanthamoebae]|uniref:Alpha-1,4 glucan phosphorylase n=1 Tax=Parachlamydia acanthamoebae TaxID=83552 RepID=A0A0C1C3W8_9BACT|nr:glycogen/starch/alpha-glucan phosphorylase [Parachlamydia acanthamoebae]KIA78211.1 Glycogen phosphorylase [Parachlamydia acanthamoebae]
MSTLADLPSQEKVSQDKSIRTGLSVESLKKAFEDNLFYLLGKEPSRATPHEFYMAVSYSIRDRLFHRLIETVDTIVKTDSRVVCYFSAEYLLGPQLGNNVVNLEITDAVRKAVEAYDYKLEDLLEIEPEPGLGNGGLGRLAACYLDSLATLKLPAIGYGIHYEFGMFQQVIRDGWQVEQTDKWLSLGNPWEICRPEASVEVKLGGYTVSYRDEKGNYHVKWVADRVIKGIPIDIPVLGYGVNTCNPLRLWKAEATKSFDFSSFNTGDYYKSVEDKVYSENITKVLYPNDQAMQGKQLRLEQQYFFVACSLQDMIRIHLYRKKKLENFHETFTAQLNDTHPSIAIVELMRLLVDEYLLGWDIAWETTTKTFAYTNHTLLPEALEKWAISLFARLLPRHLELIYEINRRFLDKVRIHDPSDPDRLTRMSLIDEHGERYVRMAYLACVGSHAVNGVAALHTELLKKELLSDFVELWPEKFCNITNGVTPRRFLLLSNPGLAQLITEKIGNKWITDLNELKHLEEYAAQAEFQERWRQVKLENKQCLAKRIRDCTGIAVDPHTLFDIQVKRIHEYKRQHLNVLHIITLYNRLKKNPNLEMTPRTFIFGGKAAPGYWMAKLMIKLINAVAEVVNQDSDVKGRLKVVFYPNFNVKNAQSIYPAADLSEQISTAGMEASGTSNMKLALNGALTIGTLDGANIEIREEVGKDNFFLFGLNAEEVETLRSKQCSPMEFYETNLHLREVIDLIQSGFFSHGDRSAFLPLINEMVYQNNYMILADYQSYIDCQDRVDEIYQDQKLWTRTSILNVARMGKFSSDRAIREYCQDIWHVKPVKIREKFA